jgi:hypothetical protein
MDEGFEVLTLMQTGKARIFPVVLVDKAGGTYWKTWMRFLQDHLLRLHLISTDDFNLFRVAPTVDAAIEEIVGFYKNFRSYRWVGPRLSIRLEHRITTAALSGINHEFKDIISGQPVVQGAALPEEANEPDIAHLPRLIFRPIRRNFGRLRLFIDAVNAAELE